MQPSVAGGGGASSFSVARPRVSLESLFTFSSARLYFHVIFERPLLDFLEPLASLVLIFLHG